jgi:hypothetical protein
MEKQQTVRSVKSRIYFFLFRCAAVLFSCSKNNSQQLSRQELLTQQDWVIKKAEEKTGANPWIDAFPFWQACEKDDRWKFKNEFSLEMNESIMPCGTNSPKSDNRYYHMVI